MPAPIVPRPRRRHPALPSALLASLLLAGCSINEPSLPTFLSRFAVPLGEERLDIQDTLDDVEYLTTLPDGVTLGFVVDGDPDTVGLDLDLAADIAAQDIHAELGSFALDLAAPVALDRTLDQLIPEDVRLIIEPRQGTMAPVPGFEFVDQTQEPHDIADCTSATLDGGQLTATVANGLPVPISDDAPPYQVTLEILDAATGVVVTSVAFAQVASGDQQQQTTDLAGVVLPDSVNVRLMGGSPGSGGQAVMIDLTAGIGVELSFTDLVVSEAVAVVPAQSFTTELVTDLPADYEVTEARIASGTLPVAVANELPLPVTATVRWPEVLDAQGAPLVRTWELGPQASLATTVDFAGLRIASASGPDVPVTALTATVEAVSPGSAGQPVPLQSDQGLDVAVGTGRLAFASVTGRVPEQTIDLEPVAADVDLPEELAGLELTHASLTLLVTNGAEVPATAQLSLAGTSAAGVTEVLAVNAQIDAATGPEPLVTEIVLDEVTEPALLPFLNNLPETITLTGAVALGGGGAVGTVDQDDFAAIGWRVEAPVEVRVREGGARLVTDPRYLDLDQDLRDLIRDHAEGAALDLTVSNHFPLGLELNVLFSPDTATVRTDPLLTVGPIRVAAAPRDPIDHTAIEALISQCQISLTAAEAKLLATEGLVTVIRVDLPYEAGDPARVLSTDHVTVSGVVDLDVEISDPE